MPKTFLLILSTKKSLNRNIQRSTLNNDKFIKYYFIGDPTIESPYEVDEKRNIVYLKTKDDNKSLKTYYAFQFIKENYFTKIRGIFKTEDNITLNINLIESLIKNDNTYFGQKLTKDDVDYCSGDGYYINKKYIKYILENKDTFTTNEDEDICVGLSLNKNNVYPNDVDINNACYSKQSEKVAVIVYHKNAKDKLEDSWINKTIESIKSQTFSDFYVYDLNYGNDDFNLSNHFQNKYKKFNKELNTQADALNYLLDECKKDNFDVVFNVRLGDYYDVNRLQSQLEKIREGYDLISSDLQVIKDDKLAESYKFSNYNHSIKDTLFHDNIIAHPSVCYGKKIINEVRYDPNEKNEDYELWKRIIKAYRFYICDLFTFYRVDEKQKPAPKPQPASQPQIPQQNINFNSPLFKKDYCRYCGGLIQEIVKSYPPNSGIPNKRYKMCSKCNRLS